MRCAVLLLLLGGALSGARALPQSSSSALPSAANGKSGSPRDKVLAEPETIIDVTPSDDLAAKLSGAAEGDALELADGMYNLPATLAVDKKVTIRAKNARQAILDGGGKIRVLSISADAVVQDLVITGGYQVRGGDGRAGERRARGGVGASPVVSCARRAASHPHAARMPAPRLALSLTCVALLRLARRVLVWYIRL